MYYKLVCSKNYSNFLKFREEPELHYSDIEINTLKNTIPKTSKFPSFFKDYHKLFNQSNIIEKIIPRKLNSHKDLERMGCSMYQPIDTDIETTNKGLIDPLYDLLD